MLFNIIFNIKKKNQKPNKKKWQFNKDPSIVPYTDLYAVLYLSVIFIISNFLITGTRNYSIYWAKLFHKIRHKYMITSSKHNINNEPKN